MLDGVDFADILEDLLLVGVSPSTQELRAYRMRGLVGWFCRWRRESPQPFRIQSREIAQVSRELCMHTVVFPGSSTAESEKIPREQTAKCRSKTTTLTTEMQALSLNSPCPKPPDASDFFRVVGVLSETALGALQKRKVWSQSLIFLLRGLCQYPFMQ